MKLKPLLIASILFTGVAGAAYAIDGSCTGHWSAQPWKMDAAKRDAFFTERQEALRKRLKLQANQEAAWTAFAAAMKPPANATPPLKSNKANAVERMEQRLQVTQTHQAIMQKRLDTLKTFYAQLNPDQRKVLDQIGPRADRKPRDRQMQSFDD